ncbi:MAG TPA: hypothetical protein VHO26_08080 [Propionibacteriaceae bacterium]|nr:hypothetical protein [Propionibacteriaceae bacterium]
MSSPLADFLFEAVNFLILAAVLGWLFFKPVRSALARERDERGRVEAETAQLHADAEELAERTRQAWSGVDADIAAHREELLAAARAEVAQLKDQARAAQAEERRAVDDQLRASREAEAERVAGVVGDIAAASVSRLLTSVDGPSLDAALVRLACEELSSGPPPGAGVQVESARPLDPADRDALARVLGPGFFERVVPDLGAGVRVLTASGQVDATASGLARHAARALARESAADDRRGAGDG